MTNRLKYELYKGEPETDQLHQNLFGELAPLPKPQNPQKSISWKDQIKYRKATGPEKCKDCSMIFKSHHGSKIYYKCRLIGDTFSASSDIRLTGYCPQFKRRTNESGA